MIDSILNSKRNLHREVMTKRKRHYGYDTTRGTRYSAFYIQFITTFLLYLHYVFVFGKRLSAWYNFYKVITIYKSFEISTKKFSTWYIWKNHPVICYWYHPLKTQKLYRPTLRLRLCPQSYYHNLKMQDFGPLSVVSSANTLYLLSA